MARATRRGGIHPLAFASERGVPVDLLREGGRSLGARKLKKTHLNEPEKKIKDSRVSVSQREARSVMEEVSGEKSRKEQKKKEVTYRGSARVSLLWMVSLVRKVFEKGRREG